MTFGGRRTQASGVMFARAVLAYLALPGVVAFAIPGIVVTRIPNALSPSPLGIALFAVGAALHLWCVREFYLRGKGTLAPWAPPAHLVTGGLYRYSRNPMYVAVLLVLAGWALAYSSRALAVYAGVVGIAFHVRVVLAEEPTLQRTFGEEWRTYRRAVPRWLLPVPSRWRSGKNDA